MNKISLTTSSLEERRFLDSLKRRLIKITLKDTEITGVIQKIGQTKTLVLEDVCEVKTGRKFPGAKQFFGHEIVRVEFPVSGHQENLFRDEKHISEFNSLRKKIMLDDVDENNVNYVVIDELHENFGPAVMLIQDQQVIGLGADVYGQPGQERLCWLQVSTKKVVYLFDVLMLGGQAFKNGLAMILESPNILKVVHDCRFISRCLRSEFRVKLNNVFDTQVSDLLLFFNETAGFLPDRVSSLSELLKLHLQLSNTELQAVQNKEQISRDMWYVRPCPPGLFVLMAQSVVQLLPLRLKLLDSMMNDYTRLVEAYMTSIMSFNQDEWALPPEVQELVCVNRQRKEWAKQCFSLTNAGLLERSSFRTHK